MERKKRKENLFNPQKREQGEKGKRMEWIVGRKQGFPSRKFNCENSNKFELEVEIFRVPIRQILVL